MNIWKTLSSTLSELNTSTHAFRVGLVGHDFGDLSWGLTIKQVNSPSRAAFHQFPKEDEAKAFAASFINQLTNATKPD